MRGAVEGSMVLDVEPNSWDRLLGKPVVIYTGSSFMMWYTAFASWAANSKGSIGLATSADGKVWSRDSRNPVLNSGGGWDAGGVYDPWVIYENGTYKMWMTGTDSNSVESIGYATSTDGVQWTMYSGNPILTKGEPGSMDDQMVMRPVVVHSASGYVLYFAFLGTGDTGSHPSTATSNDGIHWVKSNKKLVLKSSGWDVTGPRPSSIALIGQNYVMAYYSVPASGANQYRYQIGLATSTDGVNWAPYSNNPVITFGSGWDGNDVYYPCLVPVGDNYYIYYIGDDNSGVTRIGLAIVSTIATPENLLILFPVIVLICSSFCLRNRKFAL